MLYELAFERVSNRNMLIDESKLQAAIDKASSLKKELYHSFYLYDEEVTSHFKIYKTIASFRGICKLKHLIFDIDKQKNTDEFTLTCARAFVDMLKNDWSLYEDEVHIWFSGRGYHIEIPEYFDFGVGEHVVGDVKNTITEYFPQVDPTLYDFNHIIRAPYSFNSKSNLFKIPLTHEELYTLTHAEIHKLAESNEFRFNYEFSLEDYEERKNVLNWHEKIIHNKVVRQALANKNEPTAIVTCMQKLWEKGATVGTRHIELLRLVSAFRRQGVPKGMIVIACLHWAGSMEAYEVKRVVEQVFDKGYVYGCNDNVMSKYCDNKCIYYKHKNYTVSVFTANDLESELAERFINDKLCNINLKRFFKLDKDYKIYEDEVVMFIADTKLGKSTLIGNIAVAYPEYKWLCLSLENGKLMDLARLIQISTGKTEYELEQFYKEGNTGLTDYIQHIKLADDAMTLEDVRKLIVQHESKIVVIDTLDQLNLKGDGYTGQTEYAAKELKSLAKALHVIIIAIHHISKAGSMEELTVHSSKGSSSVEQKADKMLGMTGNQNDTKRRVKSLLARNATPFDVVMNFDKNTFRFVKEGE